MKTHRPNAIAAAMTALSHPRRVRIFDALLSGPKGGLTFEGLMKEANLSASTLIHHLKPMLAARLVATRRKGRYVFHVLRPGALDDAYIALRPGSARQPVHRKAA